MFLAARPSECRSVTFCQPPVDISATFPADKRNRLPNAAFLCAYHRSGVSLFGYADISAHYQLFIPICIRAN